MTVRKARCTKQSFYVVDSSRNRLDRNSRDSVGILRIDYDYEFQIGDVDSPVSWSKAGARAVHHSIIETLTFDRLKIDSQEWLIEAGNEERLRKAVKEFLQRGATIITANCGFFIVFQELVKTMVGEEKVNLGIARDVTVILSGLVLLPSIRAKHSPGDGPILVFTSDIDAMEKAIVDGNAQAANLSKDDLDAKDIVVTGGSKHLMPKFFAEINNGHRIDTDDQRAILEGLAEQELANANHKLSAVIIECTQMTGHNFAIARSAGAQTYDIVDIFRRTKAHPEFDELLGGAGLRV